MNAELRKAQLLRRMNDAEHKPAAVEGEEIFLPLPDGRMRALLYRAGRSDAPLFVDIHGGAFIFASPEEDDFFCASLRRTLDMCVVSLDYPLAPEAKFPVALEAIYAAILGLRARAAQLGFDPENISIGGHSAGGNLAAAICMMAKQRGDFALRCQLLAYPAVDMGCAIPLSQKYRDPLEIPQDILDFAASCYATRAQFDGDALCTPCLATTEQLSGLPPAIVLTCEHDSLRTEGEIYAANLVRAGVDVTFRRFPGACHGFTIFPDPLREQGLAFLFDALRRCIT